MFVSTHRRRVTPCVQAKSSVLASNSPATSGAPQLMPRTSGTANAATCTRSIKTVSLPNTVLAMAPQPTWLTEQLVAA